MRHARVDAIGLPGSPDRQWQCVFCGTTGTLSAVNSVSCDPVMPEWVGDDELLDVISGEVSTRKGSE